MRYNSEIGVVQIYSPTDGWFDWLTTNPSGLIAITSPVNILPASEGSEGFAITGGWSQNKTSITGYGYVNGLTRSGDIVTLNDIDMTNIMHVDGQFSHGSWAMSRLFIKSLSGEVVLESTSAVAVLDTSSLKGFYKIGYEIGASGYEKHGNGSCSITSIRIYTTA